jgi:hypothetical protein
MNAFSNSTRVFYLKHGLTLIEGHPGVLIGGGVSSALTWPKTSLVWAQTDSVQLKRVHTDPYMGLA